ncbi:MAG TPA: PEP-CTERM sorting domain-containing protein [Anaerohalosphaeraceae bacterium]|nr:PEP-CTERM sorting domain-containing protein [Anaerohalosphaeraceae bacterium]HRT51249.1 PEP-CTERM sorting domain-containing protein [Anaerohalosphaeraceae bacterium]HRT87440.1 PEP-CTERM sorting domain-containing protein [Anaerohalosphaeraceae bacterium]
MKPLMPMSLIAALSVSAFATIYTVTDGYFNSMTIDGYDSLIMTGGGAGLIWGRDNGVLDIESTSSPYVYGVSGIGYIKLWENSQLHLSGGSVRLLEMTDNVSVVLTGGQIDEINAYYPAPGDLNHITIHCKPGWTYQAGYLSGLWLDGSSFNIKLYSQGASGVFDNITFVPEPATLLLMALGGSFLLRPKRA